MSKAALFRIWIKMKGSHIRIFKPIFYSYSIYHTFKKMNLDFSYNFNMHIYTLLNEYLPDPSLITTSGWTMCIFSFKIYKKEKVNESKQISWKCCQLTTKHSRWQNARTSPFTQRDVAMGGREKGSLVFLLQIFYSSNS